MDNNIEYAPEYSRRERIRLALVVFLVALIGYWFIDARLEPWIREFGSTAPCTEFLGYSGLVWLWYGIFAGIPASAVLVAGAFMLPTAVRGIKSRQFPPPGQKVFRRTKIRRGRAALLISLVPIVVIVCLAGVAVWGANQAQAMIERTESREHDCRAATDGSAHATIVPPPIFATVETGILSNAPGLRGYADDAKKYQTMAVEMAVQEATK